MLAKAAGVSKIIIACGRTDLRKGIDALVQLVGTKYAMNPFEKNVLSLFCGGRGDRIKGLASPRNRPHPRLLSLVVLR